MSTFDLERARAGDPIEYYDGGWRAARFVDASGSSARLPIVEYMDKRNSNEVWTIKYVDRNELLRMAPKKVTVRYRVFAFKGNMNVLVSAVDSEEEALSESSQDSFLCWLTEWQTAEIPQPDLTDKETR